MTLRLAALCLLAGCSSEVLGDRAAEMRTLFIGEDRELAAARPALVTLKYQTMASGRYEFLRGEEGLFYEDATQFTGTPAVVDTTGANLVPLFGDAHLENVGTAPAVTSCILESTDFDATLSGPFDWEVRRAAQGIAVLDGLRAGHPAAGDPTTITPSVGAFVDGYLRGVTDATLGDAGPIPTTELGTIILKQLAKASGLLATHGELAQFTTVTPAGRRILRDDELIDIVSPWDQGLDVALATWSQTRRAGPLTTAQLAVKDIAQRLDSGVSSLALWRFYVLIENGPGDDDDMLIEVKEERDPPAETALLGRGSIIEGGYPGVPVPDNAARVVSGATQLLASAEAEPDFGRTSWNNVAFFVRTASAARMNLESADLASDLDAGKTTDADLADLTSDIGRMVGRAHAHAAPGSAAAILRAVDAAARQRIITRAIADAAQLATDFTLFNELLQKYGPLLGPPALTY